MKLSLRIALMAFLAIFISLVDTRAQTPGGVAPAAWYRAGSSVYSDNGTNSATDNGTVQQWNSQVGNFPLIQSSSGSRPVFSNATTLANFNPTVTFDGSNDHMQFTAGTGINMIDRANGTLLTAGYMNRQKGSGFAGFHPSMDFPGLHFFNNYKLLFFTSGGPGYQGLSDSVSRAQTYFTSGSSWQNGTTYAQATVSFNGNRKNYSGNEIYNVNLTNNDARHFRIGGDSNWGALSGQLNEILIYENRLTEAELDRVETYLAIKYGTTYANGGRDYVNAVGNTVWTADATYKHNIAGIAQDNAGALSQKQSWSTNTGQQVLIGVGALANTNAGNAATLTDGQYLIWADNGLQKAPSVATADFAGLSHHFASIWKVQNTGSVGTVRVAWPKGFNNLSLIQSTDAVIGAGDNTTIMSSEATINGIIYNYADITLANGSYFTFGVKLAAPGGVTGNLRVWLKPDAGFTPFSWSDFSGFNNHYTQTNTSRQPFTAAKNYNFNPVIDFGNTGNDGRFMVVPAGKPYTANGTSSSIFTVNLFKSLSGYADVIGFGATTTTDSYINANYPVYTKLGNYMRMYPATGVGSNLPLLTANKLLLNDASFTVGSAGLKYGLNGQSFTVNTTYTAGYSLHANGSILGSQPERANALIGEVIAYERDLSEPEKQRVRTYIAIKYGITLPHNYIASDGSTTVWDLATNTGYNNNIAGLANDEGSLLSQKQSNSINEGQQVLVSTTGLADNNLANATSLTSGQFLLWGDNGLGKVPSVALSSVANVNFRFASVWKVNNIGNVGTVRVLWPAGLTNLTLIQGTDPTFGSVGTSTPMASNIVTVNDVSYNFADVTLANGQYFTFATQLNGPGGVALDLRVWLRSDAGFAPQEWSDLSGNSNHYTQTNAERQPFTATTLYNFNPIVDFGNTGTDARFMAIPAGKPYSSNGTNSTIFTAFTNRSVSGFSDIIGFGSTTTNPGLVQANQPVYTIAGATPQLFPNTGSTSTIQINKLYLNDVSYTIGSGGVKYGQNGILNTVNSNVTAGNALHASGGILGSQGEVRNGLIGEVIAYERDLTDSEKERVRSYVAIKYGITLPHNYTAANNTTIFWDQTLNTNYNNNIAGIARDNMGSLNQRQSSSINSSKQVLISTLGLANNNASNPTQLDDQQFLIWGDNGLSKSPSVAFANFDGLAYNRFASVWKVQNTGSVGTVRVAWPAGYANMKLIVSDDENFTTDDDIYEMTGNQVINGIEYVYSDVSLANGQYFTFAAFLQAPGGVTAGILMWHKADDGILNAGYKNEWKDVSGNGRDVSQPDATSREPELKTEAAYGSNYFFNFNPSYFFDGGDYFYRGEIYFPSNNSAGSTYGVSQGSGTTYGWGDDDPNIYKNGNQYQLWRNNGIAESGNVPTSGNNVAQIGGMAWRGSTNGVYINANGRTYSNTSTNIGSIQSEASNYEFAIGSEGFNLSNSGFERFTGGIPEVFAYSEDHQNGTLNEKARINSYLALKYGITLSNDAGDGPVNYLSSASNVVWNATANAQHSNNIAGLANDFASALHQKQSRSVNVNVNNQVIIGLGDIAETNASNMNSLADGEFLVWGDNGNTQAMNNVASSYTPFTHAGSADNGRRMNRVWKVQNTGVNQQVLIRFPKASVGTTTFATGDNCADYAIIFADDADFTTNVTLHSLTDNDLDFDVSHTFPNGSSYFTYAKIKPWNQGLVYLPSVLEETDNYTDPCDVGDWKYFRSETDNSRKLIGMAGFTNPQMDNLVISITLEGTEYNDGTRHTRLMSRITTIQDNNVSGSISGKVRVYYNPVEMDDAVVPGFAFKGWFKYEGDASDILGDIFSDGLIETSKALAITPNILGIEDGVHYAEFHGINSFNSFVYISSTEESPLPVTLTHFKATKEGNTALLDWATASEQNNSGFEVERSDNARDWNSLGFVTGKGDSATSSAYSFTDTNPLNGTNYYRLKQVDLDGSYEYSRFETVQFNENPIELVLYPNPVVDGEISLKLTKGVPVSYKIYSVSGIEILSKKLVNRKVEAGNLPAGMYIIKVHLESGEVINKSFIVK